MSELVERLRNQAGSWEEDGAIRFDCAVARDPEQEAALLREAADALEAAHKVLAFLVELKDQKDAGFKTFIEEERYRALKPAAWERARIIVQSLSSGVQGGEREG